MTVETDTSLRDDIASAFEATEAPEAPASAPVEASPAPEAPAATPAAETPTQAAARARDEAGRYAKGGGKAPTPAPVKPTASAMAKTPASAASPVKAAAAPLTDGAVAPEGDAPEAPAPEVKPPAGWTAAEREAFKAWPRELQETAVRRERDYAVKIQQHAEGARFGQQVQRTLSPFVQPILARGGDPLQTMESLFRTSYALESGSPQEKAAIVAQILDGYGIDLELVNAKLSQPGHSAQGQGQQPHINPDQLVQQAEQRVYQRIQQERQQALYTREAQAMEDFIAKNEYAEDVAPVMADMLEVAAKRGLSLSKEEAYARACALDAGISRILEQRKAAAQASASPAPTQRARDAASSIRGQPTGVSNAPQSGSLRDDIEAAIASASGR